VSSPDDARRIINKVIDQLQEDGENDPGDVIPALIVVAIKVGVQTGVPVERFHTLVQRVYEDELEIHKARSQ
jgi:hypothetical protein